MPSAMLLPDPVCGYITQNNFPHITRLSELPSQGVGGFISVLIKLFIYFFESAITGTQ